MSIVNEIKNVVASDRNAKYIIAAAIITMMLLIVTYYYSTSVTYKPLFTNMTEQDISKVTKALMESNIDYELNEKKASLYVKESDISKAKILIMSEGILSNNNVGFEIFDEVEFGMTEFSQKINYQRALQGELSKTISLLDEVKYARVHIVQPSTKLFRNENDKPSASITLFVKSGKNITAKQITGIQNIVASSVDGLDINNVIISNQSGNVLSEVIDLEGKDVSSKLSHKEKIELYYSTKVKKVLATSVGENNYVVSVNVEFDYTKSVKTIENYLSKDGADMISRSRTSKNKTGGVVTSDKEYKYGRQVENIETEAGRIKRLMIGVMVPDTTTENEITVLRSVIEMAVGIDTNRGDKVLVNTSPFNGKNKVKDILQTTMNDEPVITDAHFVEIQIAEPKTSFLSNETGFFNKILSKTGVTKNNLFIAGFSLLVFSMLLNVLYLFRARRRSEKISTQDRQELLDEITDWFNKGSDNAA